MSDIIFTALKFFFGECPHWWGGYELTYHRGHIGVLGGFFTRRCKLCKIWERRYSDTVWTDGKHDNDCYLEKYGEYYYRTTGETIIGNINYRHIVK